MSRVATWSVVASNLPEHARNPIHTDEGARAAGFERALVPGVTSYAYCCHPAIERFGLDWVAAGEAEVRFRSPVFDGERLELPVAERPDGGIDIAIRTRRLERAAVVASAWRVARPDGGAGAGVDGPPRAGEQLRTVEVRLEGEYGSDYAMKAGDDQTTCARAGVVHPAVWPSLANYVFHRQLAVGPWVHTWSRVRHHGLAADGAVAEVATTVVHRYLRHGERAVADVVITVGGRLVATLEHEAIVDLAAGEPSE